ncbi:MAG: NUDIX hydrolase [Acidobacteriota bacterium]
MSEYIKVRHRLAQILPEPVGLMIEPERIPQAAVTILIREEADDDQLLLIQRAERVGDPWSGHLALPGGRVERQDSDLRATAARETYEEVGIDLSGNSALSGYFIGHLSPLCPRSPDIPPLEITPLVAIAPPEHELQLSPEVSRTWWISIDQLSRQLFASGPGSEHRINLGSYTRKWPAYDSPGGPIWGITERILTQFLTLLK